MAASKKPLGVPSLHGMPAAGTKRIGVARFAAYYGLPLYRHSALHGHRRSPLARGATKDAWRHKGQGKA
jgi:hypothetical protein